MPQDAFTLKFVTQELKPLLIGGKISRINQPNKDELSFIIYTKNGTIKLEISAQAQLNRISLSDLDKPNPINAPNFCMLLRKHLQNAEILDVEQLGFERIVCFTFLCTSDFSQSQMKLYCEIMGKYSNIILTENNKILGALKTTSLDNNTRRILFPGAIYQLPPRQDKIDPNDLTSLQTLFDNWDSNTDIARAISTQIEGIAYSTALEILDHYPIITAQCVYDFLHMTPRPCVTYRNGQPEDFKVYSSLPTQKQFETLLQAQKAYYDFIYTQKTFEGKKKKLEGVLTSAIKKVEKRLQQIADKLCECEEAELVRLKGELLTANLYAIQKGMDSFEAVNYYDEQGGTIKISLDKQLTPSQNAQRYYKKYAKLKRTIETLSIQQIETEERLAYLSSIQSNITTAESLIDLLGTEEELIQLEFIKPVETAKKKKATPPSPYRVWVYKGFKIIAGRNNVQNERLTKELNGEDLWLHTQKYHSSHVGILTEGKEVPDDVLGIAASICAYYSSAQNGNKVPVDYCKKRFVKKPPHSAVGFVIYTDYKTVLMEPNAQTEWKIES